MARDYLDRALRVGDVVVYAVLIGRLSGGQPLRRGVILGFEGSYAWIRMRRAQGRPATVKIHQDRVLVMPDAIPDGEAAQLRAHSLRLRTPIKRAQRRESWPWTQPAASGPSPITPEQTLAVAGIDDARQAEYQRKMSALLPSRS